MSLSDEDASVVDGLGEAGLEDLGLETTLKEIFELEGQAVIESHAALVEHTDAHQTAVCLENNSNVSTPRLCERLGI